MEGFEIEPQSMMALVDNGNVAEVSVGPAPYYAGVPPKRGARFLGVLITGMVLIVVCSGPPYLPLH